MGFVIIIIIILNVSYFYLQPDGVQRFTSTHQRSLGGTIPDAVSQAQSSNISDLKNVFWGQGDFIRNEREHIQVDVIFAGMTFLGDPIRLP